MQDLQTLIEFMEELIGIHQSRLASEAADDDDSLLFLKSILVDLRGMMDGDDTTGGFAGR
ncbi:MAG: hypothetical protein DI556_09920 [Rhodovulum sulfidophilum]|uniref:Uncharacterized protein n=1 Tax=Rhodovulum sulfidophilum TaxID=35806 RepID=A0A2W5NB56_RHOSU|nr:MAG: hypothetical protein DI556_09920 [Rhodovulum sulfidophilum]